MYTTGKHIELISGQLVRESVRALSAKQAYLIRDRLISQYIPDFTVLTVPSRSTLLSS